MGGFCTTGVEDLPTYEETLTGTDIPAWVSAGGRTLFEQAAELAKSDYPGYQGPRIASYGGSKLTPEEQQGFSLLAQGADVYDPYLKAAYDATQRLGSGYDQASRADLLGPEYEGASRQDLVGGPSAQFSLDQAQPFIDIYQAAADPAVAEAERQLQQQLIQQRARSGSSFGGSRQFLGEMEVADRTARAAGDIRARAGAEGLQFGAQRFDADRAQSERDRAARFQAENVMRSNFDTEREARFGAESAQRAGYETQEASRLRSAEQLQTFAPLVQGLTEQAASGLLSAGEGRRKLDQMALDLAYSDYVEQREYPFQMLNFAMGALKGVPYETTQYSLSQGQQYVQTPSIYGQTLGGLGSLASAYYMSQGR
tara:strand:- start:853 stop:1962 length:1110 start_codon:yes stop_codon:yes gene_type:complete